MNAKFMLHISIGYELVVSHVAHIPYTSDDPMGGPEGGTHLG